MGEEGKVKDMGALRQKTQEKIKKNNKLNYLGLKTNYADYIFVAFVFIVVAVYFNGPFWKKNDFLCDLKLLFLKNPALGH